MEGLEGVLSGEEDEDTEKLALELKIWDLEKELKHTKASMDHLMLYRLVQLVTHHPLVDIAICEKPDKCYTNIDGDTFLMTKQKVCAGQYLQDGNAKFWPGARKGHFCFNESNCELCVGWINPPKKDKDVAVDLPVSCLSPLLFCLHSKDTLEINAQYKICIDPETADAVGLYLIFTRHLEAGEPIIVSSISP